MKKILRILGGSALVVVVVGVGIVVVARFHDGPLGGGLAIVAGGAFSSGVLEIGSEEPDWTFLRDYETVEFQLLDPERSRTTWIMEHDGRIYIVSGYMNTPWGKLWKRWPKEAEEDGRAVLRVDDRLYQRQLVRIRSGEVVAPVLAELGRKYVGGAAISPDEVTSGNLWLFELTPRR